MEESIIREYTENNKSIQAISKQYKISWNKVKRILQDNGVEIIANRNQYSNNIQVDSNLFKVVDNSDTAYFLGLMYSDGYIRKDRNEIGLTLQEKDKKLVESFCSFCGGANSLRRHSVSRNGKKYISYDYTFSSKDVKQNLIDLGCVPQKSLILTFPSSDQVPDDYLYDFIRGYIDGDGCVQFDKSKSRYRIIVLGTQAFLEGLIQRTGWTERTYLRKQDGQNVYSLEFSKKELIRQKLEKIYGNSKQHLERKYQVYLDSLGE